MVRLSSLSFFSCLQEHTHTRSPENTFQPDLVRRFLTPEPPEPPDVGGVQTGPNIQNQEEMSEVTSEQPEEAFIFRPDPPDEEPQLEEAGQLGAIVAVGGCWGSWGLSGQL